MAKFVIKVETDEDTLSNEVLESIKSYIDGDNMKVKDIARIEPHAIYSEGDVPSRVYWNFDGYKDLELAHLEKQSSSYADEVLATAFDNEWLHCTCGELHNASPEEAIEHLNKELTCGVDTVDPEITETKVDNQTVVRKGKTGKSRRRTEIVHYIPSEDETVTFVPVRADSKDEALAKSHDWVMFPDEWETTEAIHHEGDDIYVVRLAHSGSPSDFDELETGSVDRASDGRRMKNMLTDEMVSFESVYARSPDEALDLEVHSLGGTDVRKEVVYSEDGIYVVRG